VRHHHRIALFDLALKRPVTRNDSVRVLLLKLAVKAAAPARSKGTLTGTRSVRVRCSEQDLNQLRHDLIFGTLRCDGACLLPLHRFQNRLRLQYGLYVVCGTITVRVANLGAAGACTGVGA